jgi:polysaccharide pyruvyl transferase WcaK-like protein
VRAGLATKAYVAVRDPFSHARLRAAGVERDIDVVPDTALLLPRVLPAQRLAERLATLRRTGAFPTAGRVVVVQGCDLLVPHVAMLARVLRRWFLDHPDDVPLLLTTGRCRGDAMFADAMSVQLGRCARRFPHNVAIEDIAAAIVGADHFVGSSMHGAITAFAYGRRFTLLNLAGESKLDGFAAMTGTTDRVVTRMEQLWTTLAPEARQGRAAIMLDRLHDDLDRHFDRLAATLFDETQTRRGHRPVGLREIDDELRAVAGEDVFAEEHRLTRRGSRRAPAQQHG